MYTYMYGIWPVLRFITDTHIRSVLCILLNFLWATLSCVYNYLLSLQLLSLCVHSIQVYY